MVIFSKSFVFTIIFALAYYLIYQQAFSEYPSDIGAHIGIAKQFSPGQEMRLTYPVWHILVYGLSEVFNIEIHHSAVIVTALIIVVLAIIIFNIVKYSLKNELSNLTENKKEYLFLAMTVILMVATAVYAPFFNKHLLIGQASCGVWHNVTLLMVKPFSFLSFFFTVLYFETRRLKWGLLALTVILLSIVSKPSFIIVFLPAIFIFFSIFVMRQTGLNILQILSQFIDLFKRYKYEVLFLSITSILSVLILWWQYTAVFVDAKASDISASTVLFDFLGVWSLYTPNIAGSLLLTYMFPLGVLFFVNKKESNTYMLAFIMVIISIVIYAFFAESGKRYGDGNFSWSQQITLQIFFAMSLVEFVKSYVRLEDWKKYILSTALSLHIVSGVFYLIKVSKGFQFF